MRKSLSISPIIQLIVGFIVMSGLVDRALAETPVLAELLNEIQTIHQSSGMASAYVVLVDHDKVLVNQGFGIRWWGDTRAISEQDYYRLGSISKAFAGLALLKAEEQGCFKLTDHVQRITSNPLFSNRWESTHPTTVAMLMEHTAGWHDMSGFEFKFNVPVNLSEALALRPRSRTAQWPPGLHYEYSNSGPGLAGWVLEETCDVDFDEYIRRAVFEPLDMYSATMNRTAEVDRYLVGGYNTNPREHIRYWNFLFRPSGAMNVRPVEMANFLRLLLNRGRHEGIQLFSPDQINRMETPTTTLAAKNGITHGYGLGIRASVKNGHVIHGHGGDADGYLTRFSYSKESGRGFFAVITQFDHQPLRQIRSLLENWLVEGLPDITPPEAVSLAGEKRESLLGTYQRASTRFAQPGWRNQALTVSLRNDKLGYQRQGRRWRELIPVDTGHFRHRTDPVATTALLCDRQACYLQGTMGNWVKSLQ